MGSKLILEVVLALMAICCSQLIIPKRQLGYIYGARSNDALIHLDIHMEPLCSDSRDALPAAKQVADHYGSTTLKLTLHMFPLPYIQQAYLALKYLEEEEEEEDQFPSAATANMTFNGVISMLSAAAVNVGIDADTFKAGIKDNDIDRATRAAWKYSSTHIHMGPLCPDSRDAFPTAKQVADHYGPTTLKLTLHMFPLPYHHQAYLAAKGSQIVKRFGSGDATAYKWFEHLYANLNQYSNAATANMTTNEVISMLSAAAMTLGMDADTFKAGMKDYDIERETRAAWKYSCTRAVAETPYFMLNDVRIEADTTWTLNDWKQVIDPLLQGSPKIVVGRSKND